MWTANGADFISTIVFFFNLPSRQQRTLLEPISSYKNKNKSFDRRKSFCPWIYQYSQILQYRHHALLIYLREGLGGFD
jgi:hypothetical protein